MNTYDQEFKYVKNCFKVLSFLYQTVNRLNDNYTCISQEDHEVETGPTRQKLKERPRYGSPFDRRL